MKIPNSVRLMIAFMLITGAAITVCAIIYKPDIWEIVPLYISLLSSPYNIKISEMRF